LAEIRHEAGDGGIDRGDPNKPTTTALFQC
jgi:hypothetical protein